MAYMNTSMFVDFIYATDKDGTAVQIFKRENAPDTDTVIHRTVDTIIDLGVKAEAPAHKPRARLLITSFNAVGKGSTKSLYVRETPEEISQILSNVHVEPEMWDGFRKNVGTLVASITGRGRQRAPA